MILQRMSATRRLLMSSTRRCARGWSISATTSTRSCSTKRFWRRSVTLIDFPVPQSMVEHQMDARLERVVRSLAAQGVDPRAVNVDWVTLRRRQQERATDDVKAGLIVDRIASTETIDVNDEELNHELEHAASHSGESAEAIRARLTKQGTLDRMKAKLRSDKTLDWLAQNSRIRTVAAAEEAK